MRQALRKFGVVMRKGHYEREGGFTNEGIRKVRDNVKKTL